MMIKVDNNNPSLDVKTANNWILFSPRFCDTYDLRCLETATLGKATNHSKCESKDVKLSGEFTACFMDIFLKIWANPGLFLFIFVLFTSQINYKLIKA